ncbi:hypothetical protein DEO72_LG1g3023 [Vigna unguiculata]|uniref:Uncharacterized protein n=1 Tax=Vigna unguiculata TaxID=3917 RepID=A0A4D6KZ94_VIGUN|nr:hypothetical protein DEO72_LG1g3023 [Vigna unguiculata]
MKYLAQARGSRLSENSWEACCGSLGCSLGERPHLWAKSSVAQERRSRSSENSRTLQCSMLAVSSKRGLVA